MAETSLRRYLGRLVYLGFILRRDSPNGKTLRPERGGGVKIQEAFGFDLSPLVARAAEFKRLAAEVAATERVLHALRDRITIARRDIDKMIATGVYEGVPADWRVLSEAFEGLNRRVPRKATLDMLKPLADALDGLAEKIRTVLETHVKTTKMSGNDSQSERHLQNSTQNPIPNLNLVFPERQERPPSLSLNHTCRLSPSHSKIAHNAASPCLWSSTLAPTLPSMRPTGLTPGAISWPPPPWCAPGSGSAQVPGRRPSRRSVLKMPPWFLPQFCSAPPSSIAQVAIPRNLTEKARAGAFSLGPMLMALIRAKLRKGSQKMRA